MFGSSTLLKFLWYKHKQAYQRRQPAATKGAGGRKGRGKGDFRYIVTAERTQALCGAAREHHYVKFRQTNDVCSVQSSFLKKLENSQYLLSFLN